MLAFGLQVDPGLDFGDSIVILGLTTIGVAPEHRRRRIAERLLVRLEGALKAKGISTIMLEVRVSNVSAQDLYSRTGYSIVQRLPKYYNNGEDGFLMMKSLL